MLASSIEGFRLFVVQERDYGVAMATVKATTPDFVGYSQDEVAMVFQDMITDQWVCEMHHSAYWFKKSDTLDGAVAQMVSEWEEFTRWRISADGKAVTL